MNVLLQDLFSNLPGMAYRCRLDPDWTMEYISQGCSVLTGYTPEDLLGNCKASYTALIHEDDRQPVWDQIQEGAPENNPYQISYRIRTAQGEEKWVWDQGRIIPSTGDNLKYREGYITDISEQVASEKRLHKSETNFRSFIQEASEGMVLSDEQGLVREWNRAAEEITGYPRSQITGRNLWEVISLLTPEQDRQPEQMPVIQATFSDIQNIGWQPHHDRGSEFFIRRKDGEKRILKVTNFPIQTQLGRQIGGVLQDITESRRSEQILRDGEENFRKIFEANPIPLLVSRQSDSQLLQANQALLDLIGLQRTDVPHFKALDFYLDPQERGNVLDALRTHGKVQGMLVGLKKFSGESFWGLVNVLPLRFFDDDCLLVGMVDITPQREIEEKLAATNEQMEEAVMRANELAILAESRADENLRRAEQMTTLYKIGLSLTQGLDLNQTLMELYEQSRGVVHADTFYVALLDETGEQVTFPIFVDNGKYVKMVPVDIYASRNLTREVIESRSMLYLRDRTAPEVQVNHPSLQLGENVTRTYVGLPLVLQDLVIGVISVQSLQVDAYSEDEIMLLETMATQAAIAIANARLFNETQRLAITDSLTGLYTRRHMLELARKEFARARRYSHPFSVVFLDIDHFKHVNDTYGHAAGDTVLNAVAQLCQENVRQVDILGRFGGEEIMLLLPDTNLENTELVANRLRQQIASTPVNSEQGPVSVTVSIGVASLDVTCDRLETLIERSDQAMYSAKHQGRNRVVAWQTSR